MSNRSTENARAPQVVQIHATNLRRPGAGSGCQLQDPAAAQALGRLAVALRQREQVMLGAAGEPHDPPLLLAPP